MRGKHGARIQDKFYKSKTSPRFPNLDASNTWEMGQNSREGFFLGQELLLDFAAWINLTSNADNSILIGSCVRSYRTHFASLKRVDDLRGLSRLYDVSQPPGSSYTRYFKTMLKISVDRALMHHISFFFDGISFDARSIHVLCFTS